MSTIERRRWSMVTVIRVLVTVLLGGIGAAAGFKHTHDWAVHHGQTGWLAWADAVVIEGMAVVAGFEIQRDRQRNPHGRTITFPVVVLVVAFGIQMAAQVALAEPTPAGWLLAAMPALGFLVVVKLLMRRTHPAPAEPGEDLAATPHAAEQAPVAADRPEVEPVTEPALPAVDPSPVSPQSSTGPAEPVSTPSPKSPSPVPARLPRLRLPADMADRIGQAVEQAHQEGRTPTVADLRSVARISEEMAARVLADLDPEPAHNGHPQPA